MGQGIQDFYTAAQTYGFARDYQLRVAQIGDLFNGPTNNIFVYAKTASVPKRTIETVEIQLKGFKFNVPMQVHYESNSWPLTIYCDEAFIIRTTFESWQKNIFNEHNMQSTLENKIIQLNLLNDKTDTIMIYRLHGCIPQEIGNINYDLGGNGTPQNFNITFAYQYWTSQNINIQNTENLDLLSRITGSIRGIESLGQNVNNVIKGVRNLGSILSF